MKPVVIIAAAVLSLFMAPERARAGGHPHVAFALVISNNRSLGAHRPDLHYADDDGAKYFELLRTIAGDARARLLTSFDRDSARLYPSLVSKATAPDRAHLLAAASEISAAAAAAVRGGAEVDVYFVFAGHGDVEQGRGIIELADSAFSSDDLERLLRSIPATREHVILDSCNSFFMIDARKPGGRHFATAEDAARMLHDRLPHVGVFLSTSADGEVFEWSELQSGIFSHVVRSGLMGAADANADGRVSYAELNAFVATAVVDIKNPSYRPHVFARGPDGQDDASLVDLRGATARRIDLADPLDVRLTLRDREGIPLLDVHNEAGRRVTLFVPTAWATDGTLDEIRDGALVSRPITVPEEQPADAPVALLPAAATAASSRGTRDLFAALYQRPFGPRAFASFEHMVAAEPPRIYGVSRDDADRMDLLIEQIADAERRTRILNGTASLLEGAILGAGAAYLWGSNVQPNDPMDKRGTLDIGGGVFMGAGVLLAGIGTYTLLKPSAGERLRTAYQDDVKRSSGDYALAFANAETRVRELADRERRDRRTNLAVGSAVVAVSAAMLVGRELSDRTRGQRDQDRVTWGTVGAFGSILVLNSVVARSAAEKLAEVWTREPSFRNLPELHIGPTSGGAFVGLQGQF